ncbi:MAG TPA: cytochrome c oxidase subunit I [Thermomicrobiales bacterium]|nr:cytochrome c oxidase subunit I [Thermomicrobiales bacterium]
MASIAQPHVQSHQATVQPVVHKQRSGLWDWLTTIDHKKIGILYGVTAILFLMIGGLEAMLIRTQLVAADNTLIEANTYNALFTMHGTTMIFLGVMPLSVAFWNYIMVLQIGARDVAFPRLNAFSYWLFLFGGIILNMSWFFGVNEVPNQGWYGYAPLTEEAWSPTRAVDFWILSLQILGIASMLGAFNFIVTILNMRAPGMSLMRMPMFTWTTLITSILLIMAFPAITIALVFLMMDRWVGTGFYAPAAGGDPLLWQHLFWVFGHPEVYILILPAFGVVSEIVPTFSRKPLFGYSVMVYATAAIAFLGFGVWAHHMFTTGLGPTANSVFAATTMTIAIPTGVKIFNWLGTMTFGQIKFTTPMLFAVGMISQFTIGGISGVMHAVVPLDVHHNDSYFVIAHFHYVLFGGSLFGLIAGIYYWYPKVTGRVMNESFGKWNFWIMFTGFNLTFFPMHFLGLQGMPRRYYSYGEGSGWEFWNVVVSFGAFLLGFSMLMLLFNIGQSLRTGKRVGANPWDAPTLEWATTSPPPVYNFREIPQVAHRDPLWAEKYGTDHEDEDSEVGITIAGQEVGTADVPDDKDKEALRLQQAEEEDAGHGIHMPNPSYYPLIAALGMFLLAVGMLIDFPTLVALGPVDFSIVAVLGLVTLIGGIFGWSFEPASD